MTTVPPSSHPKTLPPPTKPLLKTAFLGCGNMASAMLRGAISRTGHSAKFYAATDVRSSAPEALREELGVLVFATNADAVRWAQLVVLAVKPQVLPDVLQEIAPALRHDTLVLSIAAGVPIARIRSLMGGHAKVARAMPNTPALVGEAATALACSSGVSESERTAISALLESAGLVVNVDEKLLDGVTGLSGSAPAYGFMAIEALSDAGVREGLPRDVATRLAAQTLLGAAKMVLQTGEHPGKLKDMVTSPAGTTIAGVAALEQRGFRAALMAAVEAASARSRELGK